MTLLPDILITPLDSLDVDHMRTRLNRVRQEIIDAKEVHRDPSSGKTDFLLPEQSIRITFVRAQEDYLHMARSPSAFSRSMWINESMPSAYKSGALRLITKDDFIALVDRWLKMLDIERYYLGPMNPNPTPGEAQRILAASYFHALDPQLTEGYLNVPLRNLYEEPRPVVSYEGRQTRYLGKTLAERIIAQTPVCASLNLTSTTYEFKAPTSQQSRHINELDAIERMRILAEVGEIKNPVRKTSPKA